MDSTEKYLAALDPPDPEQPAPAGHYWPDAVPSLCDETGEVHPLEYQCLSNEGITAYLASLMGEPGTSGNRAQPGVDFAALDQQWTAATYPLILAEFLAYKTGLAYRQPQQIRQDLLGVDARGRPYEAGIHQFAFFDTTAPHSTVRYADTQAYTFVHERTGYLIFRGTSSFADWRTDFTTGLTTETYPTLDTLPQTLVGAPQPARHTGFAIAWGSIAPDIERWVRDQLDHARIDKVVLSGHSLGGALAILGAHHFASKRICPVHAVITFGAPKVGGAEFKADYEHPRLGLKDRTLRIEAAEDVISILAPRWNDVHVGHGWRFDQRPLRPFWQMLLYAPFIGVQDASQKKIETIDADTDAGDDTDTRAERRTRPSNAPPAVQRTWQQYFVRLALLALWYVFRAFVRAFAAHSVETRYGLYLSTLSYRRIRKYHLDNAQLTFMRKRSHEQAHLVDNSAFTAANADLTRHLRVVRGRHPRTFRHLANRPIRVASPAKLADYKKRYKSYIA